MFQFPGFAPAGLCIRPEGTLARGFPHSESRQSKALCASYRTFGAWPVLRRRLMPRHPPRAFLRLNPVFQRFSSIYCCMSSSNPPFLIRCFKSLCACCFFVCCRQSFQSAVHLADGQSLRPGALTLELRRLELLTSSLQSWRSTS